jgi:hypothetical protein
MSKTSFYEQIVEILFGKYVLLIEHEGHDQHQ